MFQGEFQQRVAAMDLKFLADIGAMVIDSPRTDKKFGRNLLACLLISNELEDSTFSFSQQIESGLFIAQGACASCAIDQIRRQRRRNKMFAGCDGPDSSNYVGYGAVL